MITKDNPKPMEKSAINYALIGKTLLHPTKQRILKAMAERPGSNGTFSPNRLAILLGEPLGNVSYHVNDLAGRSKGSKFATAPLLELVDTAPRRGALEHFYRLTPKAKLP